MTNFPTTIQRVVIVAFENKDYEQVVASGPYFKELGDKYSRPTKDIQQCSPSLPNYLDITCGSTLNMCGNDNMSGFPKNINNIYRLVNNVGLTFGNWADGFHYCGSGCDNCAQSVEDNCGASHLTVCHHTPGTFYTDVSNNGKSSIKKLSDWYTNIRDGNQIPPNFNFITPNNCCNAHSCSIQVADKWLKDVFNLPKLMEKPWFKDGSTLFIIWFDEGGSGNSRYNVFVSPVSVGKHHTDQVTGYHTLSTIEWLFGLDKGCGNDDNPSKAMKDLFQVAPSGLSVSLSINPNTIIIGESSTLTATVTGGTAPYTYSWVGLPISCVSSNTDTIICKPGTPNTYTITVNVTDAKGNVGSAFGTLVVNSPGIENFNIYDIVDRTTNTKVGVEALKNDSGKYSVPEACTEICKRLKTIV